MTRQEAMQRGRRTLLCLVVAGLLWLALACERHAETTFEVPVQLVHLPAGLRVASSVPQRVKLSVAGPRIVLFRQECRGLSCRLDLADLTAGTVTFPSLEGTLDLDRELKVTRMAPGSLSVTLAPAAR